jgi:DNA-binding Xre family transcriptional regulator
MPVNYRKLWAKLAYNRWNKKDLIEKTGLSSRIIHKMTNNENVTVESIMRICEVLNCQPGEIMEYIPDDDTVKKVISDPIVKPSK